MGLRAKILSGFLVLATMLAVAGTWSIHEMNLIGASVQRILDENYKSIDAARTMIEALEREDSGTLLLLMGKWEEGRKIVASGDSLFQRALEMANSNRTIPGETAYLDSIHQSYLAYKKIWEKPIVGTRRQGDLDWYFQELHSSFLEAKSSVDRHMSLNDRTLYQTATNLQDRSNRAVMPGIIALISALVFTVIFNYLVNYYVVNPIVRITSRIRSFVDRQIPFEIQIDTKDEMLELASSIKDLCSLADTQG